MEIPNPATTTICATVLRGGRCRLCVCDHCTGQEIIVHTPCACHFRRGDCVCIKFSGAMTMSIPPQITAICIEKVC